MGTVTALPATVAGARLADAVTMLLATIIVDNTRRGYAAGVESAGARLRRGHRPAPRRS
jgi:hypothetical protein